MGIAILKSIADSVPQEFRHFGDQLMVQKLALGGHDILVSFEIVNGSLCQGCNVGDWVVPSAMNPVGPSFATISIPSLYQIPRQREKDKLTGLPRGFPARFGGPAPS